MQPPIATARSVWRRVFDRQNLHRLVAFLFQLSLLSTVAAVCPFILRILILPSSIQHEIPLNLVFSTCPDDLHGVCSFPTATLEYDQNSLFTRSVSYSLSVRLNFADLDQNRQLSMFQNQLSVHDAEGRLLKNYMRSAYLKEPGLVTRLTCLAFLPLYLLGFICNYSTIDILLTDSHIENLERVSTKIIYSLHDKYAQIDSAYLVIHANFGLIRHFTYFWPISFYLLIFIPTFSFLFFMLTIYWAISAAKSQPSESAVAEDEADDNEDAATESSAALNEQIPKDLQAILNSEEMAESDQFELISNNAAQLSNSFANRKQDSLRKRR
ncbi:hypothetical protein WR25_11016 [Diploscapter pachys]|uniref:Seipin n=1 Tax=Diploscapter pachys TaxID=2018661 RepID=A0A2A2K2Z7_9BILA|nr:hypothetical protein WR25_11016 [Diploscapter pachys]